MELGEEMKRERALKKVECFSTWNEINDSGWMRVAKDTVERLQSEGVEVKGIGDLWYAKISKEDVGKHIDGEFAKIPKKEWV
jgi:hypothetical protein